MQMALVRTLKLENTVVEIYDDYIPTNIEKRKENLKKLYDVINDIAKNKPKEITKNWFLTEKQIEAMKKSGKYNFI